MRLIALAIALVLAGGCGLHQPNAIATADSTLPPGTASRAEPEPSAAVVTASPQATRAQPLPFKGRLADGDPGELPPSVALSLSNDSNVVFSYREELTHDEYHIPLWFSALDPVTFFGSPLGDYGVTAFASLSVAQGDRVLRDYTAKVHVSKSYNLYSETTHKQLEEDARAAVRARIDQKLHRDADRLAQEIASSANGTKVR